MTDIQLSNGFGVFCDPNHYEQVGEKDRLARENVGDSRAYMTIKVHTHTASRVATVWREWG